MYLGGISGMIPHSSLPMYGPLKVLTDMGPPMRTLGSWGDCPFISWQRGSTRTYLWEQGNKRLILVSWGALSNYDCAFGIWGWGCGDGGKALFIPINIIVPLNKNSAECGVSPACPFS